MADFELTNSNINEWTATQFWEADPMQNNQSLQDICIYVNWESKEATIETVMNTNSTPGEIWNGLAAHYYLPDDTDFTRFYKYYNENIKPIFIKMWAKFEAYWNGSNWKGRFTEDMYNIEQELEDILLNVPSHNYIYSFDVMGSFEGKQHLLEYLRDDGIDFLSANLENEEELIKIINSIESGDVIILNMDMGDYKKELMWIQEELKEDE